MANLQHIRRRIKSVKNIQKITNAMDMIARSRFNMARENLLANLPFVDGTREVMRRIMIQMRGKEYEHPFIMTRAELQEKVKRAEGKFLFVVIASDKGLAGSFSSNIFKEAHNTIDYEGNDENNSIDAEDDENYHKKNFDAIKTFRTFKGNSKHSQQLKAVGSVAKISNRRINGSNDVTVNMPVIDRYDVQEHVEDVELITVGRKATAHFKRRGYNIIKYYHGISERPSYNFAKEIADLIVDRFKSEEIIDVTLIYTQFKSAINYVPTDVTLLPIITDDYFKMATDFKEEYIYEPDVVSILNNFLPRRLATRIYGAMLHSAASELSSRMNAMSNATDNAQELANKLNLLYNKIRQAGITSEINEIVGGAEALK